MAGVEQNDMNVKDVTTSCAGGCHNMPRPLQVDLLTLQVVSKSHVTWARPLCQF